MTTELLRNHTLEQWQTAAARELKTLETRLLQTIGQRPRQMHRKHPELYAKQVGLDSAVSVYSSRLCHSTWTIFHLPSYLARWK